MFKPALYYYTCCKSQEMSFVELYNDLGKYVDDPKRRFKTCLRAKRGLEDAAQHGGLYKDKSYLEGAVKVLQRRKDLDMRMLFVGKISIDDLGRPEIRAAVISEGTKLPYFVQQGEAYLSALDRIARSNFID